MRLWLLVILSSSTLAHVGFSISTLSLLPVSALRFDVGRVVAFCSSFASERRGRLVFLGAVVVIAIGLECAVWCCAGCFVDFGC